MMKLYQYFTPKIFSGCCGTDNTHIEEIAKRVKNIMFHPNYQHRL
jgi:methionine synthase I (cobalamin-dependent)